MVCNNEFINDIRHSHLHLVNFEASKGLCDMCLIPEYKHVNGSKCGTCVWAKQPRKLFHIAEGRSTAPLELVHSDVCEMNGIITKGGKRCFHTLPQIHQSLPGQNPPSLLESNPAEGKCQWWGMTITAGSNLHPAVMWSMSLPVGSFNRQWWC